MKNRSFFFLLLINSLIASCTKNNSNPIPQTPAGLLSISSISPTSGGENTVVTISGTDFQTIPANNIVKFNGVTAAVQTSTTTTLTVLVPAGASSGSVTVTTSDGTVTGPTFTCTTKITGLLNMVIDSNMNGDGCKDTTYYTYNSNNRLIKVVYDQNWKVNTTAIYHQETVFSVVRAASGIITNFDTNNSDYGISNYSFDPIANHYTYRIRTSGLLNNNVDSIIYTYTGDNITQLISYSKSSSQGVYSLSWKNLISYDASGNPSQSSSYQYNVLNSTWQQIEIGALTFDTNVNPLILNDEWIFLGDAPLPFLGNHNVIRETDQVLNSNPAYTTVTDYVIQYNQSNKPVLKSWTAVNKWTLNNILLNNCTGKSSYFYN